MEFIKAMRWGSKVIIPLFLLHAVLYFIYAYQLRHLEVPSFASLNYVEGQLIFEKKNRYTWIGIERDDGSREIFSCALPNVKYQSCITAKEVQELGLDTKPLASIWWTNLDIPLERQRYRYPMQVQLVSEHEPVRFSLKNGFVRDFSYEGRKASIERRADDFDWQVGMGLAYFGGIALLLFFEWIRFSRMEH
jgi:hypothetical protein